MMHRFNLALRLRTISVVLLAGLSACAAEPPVRIDGSSPEAFKRSTEAARRQLPDADRLLFDRALRTIGGRRHAVRDADALARLTFEGMTAAQVVADQRAREQQGG